MSKTAGELLEQFRKLAADEQRELFAALLREVATVSPAAPPARRKDLTEIAGKYRPVPNPDAALHDAAFSAAIVRDDHFAREGIRLP